MGTERLLLPFLLLLQPRGTAGTPGPATPTPGPTAETGPGSPEPPGPTAGTGPGSPEPPGPTAGTGPGPGSPEPPGPTAGTGPASATDSGSLSATSPEGGRPAGPGPSETPAVQGGPSAPADCLPTCICNLHPGSCDINCCCDPDCDLGCDLGDPRAAFSYCLPGSTRTASQVCVEKSLVFRNNIPLYTESVTDPNGYGLLFCVQLSDSRLNYFQQPQKVEKLDFLVQHGGPSFIPPSQDKPSSSAFYRAGDPIQTYLVASSVLSVLRQPVGMGASDLCIDGNPAGFLESKSTSCTRTFTNLSSSCTTDPALNAASYYHDFTVLKVPVHMTTVQLMQVRIAPVTEPRAPQMNGSTCLNIVSEVIYEIEFDGTRGIQSVSVQFKMTSVSGNLASSLQQRFTLQFWKLTLRSPSGSVSLFLHIYEFSKLQCPSVEVKKQIDRAPGHHLPGKAHAVTVLQSQSDGMCSQTLRYKVQFGMNVRTSCQLSISQMLEDGNCSYLQEMLYQALQGANSPQALAIIGSADPIQTEQWTSILTHNCSMQIGDCASCCVVPVSLTIQILWAEVGLQSNPQNQVLGARYWYQCQSLKSLSMTTVPLTTIVAFTDVTEWPEPPRSQPRTNWKLPFDFFFPFKVALSGGTGHQGDLTSAFMMSVTLCNILIF